MKKILECLWIEFQIYLQKYKDRAVYTLSLYFVILTNNYKKERNKKMQFITSNMNIFRDITEVIHPSNFNPNNYNNLYWGIRDNHVCIYCHNEDDNHIELIFDGNRMVSIEMYNKYETIKHDFFDIRFTDVDKAREEFATLMANKFKIHLIVKKIYNN